MWYIAEDKKTGIQEDYIPDWKAKIEIKPFTPNKIPWINAPQIDQTISVDT